MTVPPGPVTTHAAALLKIRTRPLRRPVVGMTVAGSDIVGRITRVTMEGFYLFDEARMRYALVTRDVLTLDDGRSAAPVRFDEVISIDESAARDLCVAPIPDPFEASVP